MADLIFEDPRLVSIYDAFDGQRKDLEHYVSLIKELDAQSILDIGCGTGCLANLLVDHGLKVIAVDPAGASLDFARSKPNAKHVEWILGDATVLPPLKVDLVVMTGNVAQVFVTNQSWIESLTSIRKTLHPNGYLVFEVRDPSKKAWLEWTRDKTYKRVDVPDVGMVEVWCEVTSVSQQIVQFRWTYVFESDGMTISSDSTLRFRESDEIQLSLEGCGFKVREIRDAPDRPGKEFVFIASLS
jgi:ubiquinone/menaquinone biosynthesis C-methylase UbiE